MSGAALAQQATAQQKKWKDYGDPKKATIAFDPMVDRCISEKFIIWDMKGMDSPILKEQKDIAKEIIAICTEAEVDPAFLVAYLRLHAKYGRVKLFAETKSPCAIGAPRDTPEEKTVISFDGQTHCLKFGSWSEGIAACVKGWTKSIAYVFDIGERATDLCELVRKMQYIDSRMGWRYKWEEVWEKTEEQWKKGKN
jgi:hypothetical protein